MKMGNTCNTHVVNFENNFNFLFGRLRKCTLVKSKFRFKEDNIIVNS